MRYFVTLDSTDREFAIDLNRRADGSLEVRCDGELVPVDAVAASGALNVRIGDRVIDLWTDGDGENVRFVGGGYRDHARVESERARIGARASRAGSQNAGGQVCAPMPGRVVKVLVAIGDAVEAGKPVIVVEAMKMENELCAEASGTVQTIAVSAGQTVDAGALLLELAPLS